MLAELRLLVTVAAAVAAASSQYHSLRGLQCVRPDFVVPVYGLATSVECASRCDARPNCQGFSAAGGSCQLYVFDRCSKRVRDCNCTRRAQVFIRQQKGLPPGALCPAGYTDDLCGAKYKLYGGITNWSLAKAAVDAEPGLVIMADVTDDTEMAHLNGIFARGNLTDVMLGGRQLEGSLEPAGGWYWVYCNASLDSGLWSPGKPNDATGTENYLICGTAFSKLNDGDLAYSIYKGALGECVSPFD